MYENLYWFIDQSQYTDYCGWIYNKDYELMHGKKEKEKNLLYLRNDVNKILCPLE